MGTAKDRGSWTEGRGFTLGAFGVALASLLLLAIAYAPRTDYAGTRSRSTPASRAGAGTRDAGSRVLATNVYEGDSPRRVDATAGTPPGFLAMPAGEPVAPGEGSGGPILVISSPSRPFSRYPVEILRAEGFNFFEARDLEEVDASVLDAHDVVILGEMELTQAHASLLSAWVEDGGTLIAMRPGRNLCGLMGLEPTGGALADRYVKVQQRVAPGLGITGETMQFHGTADLHRLKGATAVATLYRDATTATEYPAVTQMRVGSRGGQAMAFTYDLARSVVYTRQGNPDWVGQERDGIEPLRANEMFYGAAEGDPRPDWVDRDRIAIPQADEQQRLFANLIVLGNLHHMPTPRFWYFPDGHKAVVVMTGDNHGDAGMAPRFDLYRRQSPSNCSVPDWECVRATGYQFVGSGFTEAQAAFYNSLGFEVAVHVNTNCANWTPAKLEAFFSTQLETFASTFPTLPPPATNRNHCIAWSDWSTAADVSAAHGIRLDTNYYYWPAKWVQDRPGMFTGSGMPMRFARQDGSLIDCYQLATQMTDESGQTYPMTSDSLLERALDARGYYGAFCANMHFDHKDHTGSDAIVASAVSRGVPVVTSRQLLAWIDGRNASTYAGLEWNDNVLRFAVREAPGARNLRGMLPLLAATGRIATLTRDGAPAAFTTETLKGIAYAMFDAIEGNYVARYTALPLAGGTSALGR